MFYELRSYDIVPEKIDDYLKWANAKAVPLLTGTFGFRVIGFWHAVQKAGEELPATNVHWMIAWDSEQQMVERWAAARASTEWQTIFKEITDPNTGERIYHKVIRSTLLKPIPASPLQ
jgi:hypothetical protein